MTNLMRTLEYLGTYIDDLLFNTIGTFENCLNKVKVVSDGLQATQLRLHIKKTNFALHEIE